jgi:two-component sensor histidine kinase
MSPEFLWTVSHLLLAASCFAIAGTFYLLVRGRRDSKHPIAQTAWPLIWVFLAVGIFHLGTLPGSGETDGLIWFSLIAALAAAAVSALLIYNALAGRDLRALYNLEHRIQKTSADLAAMESERHALADQFAARSLELSETTQRFETTLRKSPVFVSNQDRNLKYTWVRNPPPGLTTADMLENDDAAIFPADVAHALTQLKQNTLQTKEHGRLELEIAGDASRRWYEVGVDPMVNDAGEVTGVTTAAIDVTQRKRGEVQQKALLRDVTHRAKNVLAVVNAVARQTASRTTTKDEFVDRFSARVQSLARAHDLLVSQDWQGVPMQELLRSQLARFDKLIGSRIQLAGPDLTLGPEATQNLGLAVHELTHNAGKYGALSNEAGQVRIVWRIEGAGGDTRLIFTWEEMGGPEVASEQKMGFGRTFIERAVGRTLDGSAKLEFRPSGVYCELEVPGYHLLRYDTASRQ